MLNMAKSKHLFVHWIIAFIFLYFVFSPVVNIPFAHHDQWRYFFGKINGHFFYAIFALARPFNSIIEHLVHINVGKIAHLSNIRLLFLVLLSIDVCLVAGILQKLKMEPIDALIMSSLLFLLPGIQSFAYMGAMPFHGAFIFAYVGYIFMQKSLECPSTGIIPCKSKGGTLSCTTQSSKRKRYLFLSILFLLAGFLTYQFMSFIFVFFVFMEFILLKDLSWSVFKRVGKQVVPFLLATGFYVLISHGILYRLAPQGTVFSPPYLLTFDFSFMSFIPLLLKGVIPGALLFWRWTGSTFFVWLMGCLFLSFVVVKFIRNLKFGIKNSLIYFIIFSGFFLSGLAPYLLKSDYKEFVIGRILFIFSAMLLFCNLVFFKEVMGNRPKGIAVFRYALSFLLITVAFSVNKNITHSVLGSNAEVSFIYSSINNANRDTLNGVHYIVPVEGFSGVEMVDDIFDQPSTRYYTANLEAIHRYVCKRMAKDTKQKALRLLPYSYSMPGESFEKEEDFLVIDLTKLRFEKI